MTMTIPPTASAPAQTGPASIYDAIGGRAAVTAAVDVLYRRLLADPVLGRYFPQGVGARHRAYVVTILGQALGGPEHYRGPDLTAAHRSLGITSAHFDMTSGHLDASLEELGVPRHLTDQIIAVVATLRPAFVTA